MHTFRTKGERERAQIASFELFYANEEIVISNFHHLCKFYSYACSSAL